MGSRAKLLPLDCEKSLAVRPLSVADVNSGGQVRRRVSPSFTDFGVMVHFCASAGTAGSPQRRRGKMARRSETEIMRTRFVIDLLVFSRAECGLASEERACCSRPI